MSRHFRQDDEQWAIIEPLLPQVHTGPERVDDRRIIGVAPCHPELIPSRAPRSRRPAFAPIPAAPACWGARRGSLDA
jgi:hypothetical protein